VVKKRFLITALSCFTVALLTASAQAQVKFGYVSSAKILDVQTRFRCAKNIGC